MQNYYYVVYTVFLLLVSCSGVKEENSSEEGVATVLPSDDNEVTVQVLKQRAFNHELVSNGKIVADGQADLRFETSGVIARIYVKNGERVFKGQKLAELDKFRLSNRTAQAKDALENPNSNCRMC